MRYKEWLYGLFLFPARVVGVGVQIRETLWVVFPSRIALPIIKTLKMRGKSIV